MNRVHRHFAYLQVSAEAHQIHPKIIGYGLDAWWPDGLGVKINVLRDFVHEQLPRRNDVLIFADAFDVMLFGGEEEIVSRFLELERRTNRSLIFNAEEYCYPRHDSVCDEDRYPESQTRWRFLNSGLIAGRVHAFKDMLTERVPDVIAGSDQVWYQRFFKEHQDRVWLDRSCFLLCAITGMETDNGVAWQGIKNKTRLVVAETGVAPSLVHFVSVAHWPSWQGLEATMPVQEAFRRLYPSAAERLLDPWRLEVHMGAQHTMTLYHGSGNYAFWFIMRMVLCTECHLLGFRQNECVYFPSLLHPRCAMPMLGLLFVVLVLIATLVLRKRCCFGLRRASR